MSCMIMSMPLRLERPPQNRLEIPFTEARDAELAGLAAASWWPELEFLDAAFYKLGEAPSWRKLWAHPAMAFQELRLRYPNTRCAIEVIQGALPHLRTLALCGEIGDEFLEALASVNLPALQDLEIRKTNITLEAARAFAHAKPEGLPALKRLGIAFESDRRQDYTDWNGTPVGRGYEPMTDLELQYDVLARSGLQLMPPIHGWPE
jgi:hypothetical protein